MSNAPSLTPKVALRHSTRLNFPQLRVSAMLVPFLDAYIELIKMSHGQIITHTANEFTDIRMRHTYRALRFGVTINQAAEGLARQPLKLQTTKAAHGILSAS